MKAALSRLFLMVAIVAIAASPRGMAQQAPSSDAPAARANAGTISIISGGVDGTYVRIAADVAAVLDDGQALRVLPVLGKGSLQNIADILYLHGIDIGIVQSDVLAYVKQRHLYPGVEQSIQYIAKLYDEEVHILAHKNITRTRSGTHGTGRATVEAGGFLNALSTLGIGDNGTLVVNDGTTTASAITLTGGTIDVSNAGIVTTHALTMAGGTIGVSNDGFVVDSPATAIGTPGAVLVDAGASFNALGTINGNVALNNQGILLATGTAPDLLRINGDISGGGTLEPLMTLELNGVVGCRCFDCFPSPWAAPTRRAYPRRRRR